MYVDDIPSPPGCLHGAFIYSKKPTGPVETVKFNSKEKPVAFVTAADIPAGGRNIGSFELFDKEPLFASDSAGQPLGIVVRNQ